MSIYKTILLLLISFSILLSCRSPFTNLSNETPANYSNMIGKYTSDFIDSKGVSGKMELALQGNQTFVLTKNYPNTNQATSYEKGRISFTSDGKFLALKSNQDVYLHYFKVRDDRLLKVNIKGKELKKEKTTLVKDNFNYQIEGKYWKLIEINSQKTIGPFDKEPHIKFNTSDNTFGGYSGCNGYSGTYKKDNSGSIKISSVASTKKYCAETPWESDYFVSLENSVKFTIENDTLKLSKEKGDPILVFVAIYF
ncbi:MAG: META domain-containing protein [Bacteroidetes bacterium]|nr:META domain-containing protein [Bacteroidota bacterium]